MTLLVVFLFVQFYPVIVHLKPVYELTGHQEKAPRTQDVALLKEKTRESQKPFLAFIEKDSSHYKNLKTFTVFNGIYIECDSFLIEKIKNHPSVEYITEDRIVPLIPLYNIAYTAPETLAWHIQSLRIPEIWNQGFRGNGIVIGIIDTGIDTTLKDLNPVSLSFRDVVFYQEDPYDDFGHGTFVSGLLVGKKTGVAPDASLIVVKAFTASGGFFSDIHEAFQFFLDLKGEGTEVNIINGSFGTYPLVSEFFEDIKNLRDVGIIPVFAIGNSGPYASTTSSPGNYPNVFGIGSSDSLKRVSDFSSRGPAPQLYPWANQNYWPEPQWNFLKPNLVAPGEDILSLFPDGYVIASGTSASSPLFSGILALFLNKNPELNFDSLYRLTTLNAYKPLNNLPNNTYGYGIIDPLPTLDSIDFYSGFFVQIKEVNFKERIFLRGDTLFFKLIYQNIGQSVDSLYIKLNSDKGIFRDSIFYYSPFLPKIDTISTYFYLTSGNNGDTVSITISFSDTLKTQTFEKRAIIGISHISNLTIGNELKLTVCKNGALGFETPFQERGEGLRLREGKNLLYYGSPAFASSPDYVADRFYEIYGVWDQDFEGVPVLYDSTDFYMSFRILLNDMGTPDPKALQFYQTVFAPISSQPFLLLSYKLFNQGIEPFDPFYSGIFMDFDVLPFASSNRVGYDPSREMIYTYSDEPYPLVGIFPLERGFVSVINNEEVMYPIGGMTDSLKFSYLSGKIQEKEGFNQADYTLLASSGFNSLAPGDSLSSSFGIVGGANLSELKSAADSLYNFYIKVMDIPNSTRFVRSSSGISQPYPNPWDPRKGALIFEIWSKNPENINLSIWTPAGRRMQEIFSMNSFSGRKTYSFNANLPQGVYFLALKGGKKWMKKKFIIIRP